MNRKHSKISDETYDEELLVGRKFYRFFSQILNKEILKKKKRKNY